MKGAIVHEWLEGYAGAERVLEQLLLLFPAVDLFVVSSSHAVAKGCVTGPRQLHIAYVHSPLCNAWDMQSQYLSESRLERGFKSFYVRTLLFWMRSWDVRSSFGVDFYIAISTYIARRIWKCYRRNSGAVHPSVDTAQFAILEHKEDFYLIASRFVPYKRVAFIAQASAKRPDRKLTVVGDGQDRDRIAKTAADHANIEVRLPVGSDELVQLMRRAKAFVFIAEEDFGITIIEAQAYGMPVIAYDAGRSCGIVIEAGPAPTGNLFPEQTAASLNAALDKFEAEPGVYTPAACRTNAMRFSHARFHAEFKQVIAEFRSQVKDRRPAVSLTNGHVRSAAEVG